MRVCIFGDLHGEPREIPPADGYMLVGDFSEYFDTTSDPLWKFYVRALMAHSPEEKYQMFTSEKMIKAIKLSIDSSIKTLTIFDNLKKPVYYITGNREFYPDFLIEYFCLDIPLFLEKSKDLKNSTCINLKRITLGSKSVFGIPYIPSGFHREDWKLPGFEEIWDHYAKEIDNILQNSPFISIILSHNPPFGVLDAHLDDTHLGINFFNDYILEKKPELFICGHAHGYYGEKIVNQTRVLNLAFRNFEILEL
ncbi:MAG: metallophosphoesterase [Candidatus Heimdallarchaeota archaeon]|nr:MAG: metallophosphoesterase [Candidatus Heimdallarchaeota archaeon]